MRILVTGCAGFIGSNLTDRLLEEGHEVIGVDNFNDYYDPKIKESNLKIAKTNNNFKLYREDILSFKSIKDIFKSEKLSKVVHLAARAGVRPSIENPFLYTKVNVQGTINLMKLSVDFDIEQFIFGSSSSVYGISENIPFREDDRCEKIISPYGASKRSAEFWVECFNKTYGLNTLILRFFTVYGPRGRPDMAPALFLDAILRNKEISQFGKGDTSRDYTYIDDIIEGIYKAMNRRLNFKIVNLGNNKPVLLTNFIKVLEKITNKKAKMRILPRQVGDVSKTWANIDTAEKELLWTPKYSLEEGLSVYFQWLKKIPNDFLLNHYD